MLRKINANTRASLTYQRIRPTRYILHENLEPLPQPCGPWTDISMDLIIGLPESCQKHHAKQDYAILAVVNWFTKQASYFPCYDLLVAIGLAGIIARN
jgi:hypothetical protein